MGAVLITGASTGIGRATALRLDAAGWRVLAGVRREEDAAALRAAGSERLSPLLLDVCEPEQIAAAAVVAAADPDGLAGLVNNAGVAIPGPLETLPIEELRRQVEVNLIAQVAVTQAMAPAIRRAGGRIVFLSSIGGRVAFPFTGAYHAAKFGIEAVGDVFRQELRPWGIRVAIVEPGSIDTPIWERGQRAADGIGRRAAGIALRRGDRALPEGRPADRRTRDPAGEGGGADRARAQRRAPPHALPGRARRQAAGTPAAADPDPPLGPDRGARDGPLGGAGGGRVGRPRREPARRSASPRT